VEDWAGKTLSKVRIDRLIGRGGMADVYIGRHVTLDRPMAVKILHAHMSDEPDLRRRFQEEAKAVASLRHPNIVQVVDFDVVDDRPYIVMELLEGMSLASYLRGVHGLGHSLPLETIARLITSVSSALDYAHAKQIVHRDVKPANIVLRRGASPLRPELPLAPDVEPVLTDFGVARIATSTTRTASGTVLGTPAYMSPEQVMGQVVDARSDIYSLGIILYEMLAGKLPFNPDTDTPASILYKHVHEKPPQLADVGPATEAVVHKALAKDRAARYQKAGTLAADLQAAVKPGTQVSARPSLATEIRRPSTAARSAAQPKKSALPTVAIAGGIGLAALVLIGGVLLGARFLAGATAGEPTQPSQPVIAPGPTLAEAPTLAATFVPSEVSAPPPSAGPSALALVKDSGLTLVLPGVQPPPAGSSYHAWLLGGEGVAPLNLNRAGQVELLGSELHVTYSDPTTHNLLAGYQILVISLEPEGSALLGPGQVLFTGGAAAETASLVRLADEVHRDMTVQAELPGLLERQFGHFFSHAGYALEAFAVDNLIGGKTHSEHCLNILEGKEGELFGDYDGNNRADNPGDDVGAIPYLRLLEAAANGSAAADEARGGSGEEGRAIAARAADLAGQLLDVRDTLRQILLADSVADIRSFGLDAQLQQARALQDQIAQLAADARGLDLVLPILVGPAG
jgi:serine/threonine-protein kinase